MRHRSLLRAARPIFRALLPVLLLSASCGRAPARGGSVVLALVDTLRADHVGCYGCPWGTTPEIDRLARRGALFERTYSTAPWTFSSTASIVTGLYPATHGGFTPGAIRNHSENPYPPPLSQDLETLQEVLGRAGWRTALFSANAYVGLGIEQGFEHQTLEKYDAERQTKAALAWIGSIPREQDLFALVHYVDVHEPNQPPRIYRRMFPGSAGVITAELKHYGTSWGAFGTAKPEEVPGYEEYRAKRLGVYAASVRFTDEAIGRLVRGVEEARPDGRTMFIVTSDHGEEFWDHSSIEAASYLDPRGVYGLAHGHSFFEELTRVPLVFFGEDVPAGRVEHDAVSQIDFMPTILEHVGARHDLRMQGLSLAARFRGEALPERGFLLDAVVYGRDKKGLVSGAEKLIVSPQEPTMLFDLASDPGERRDVSGERPERVAALRERLDSLLYVCDTLGEELRGELQTTPAAPNPEQVEILRALGYVQ